MSTVSEETCNRAHYVSSFATRGRHSSPSGASSLLYDNIQMTMASSGVDMDDFYHLFMVSSMQHCRQSVYDALWYFGGSEHASTLSVTSAKLSRLPLVGANDS